MLKKIKRKLGTVTLTCMFWVFGWKVLHNYIVYMTKVLSVFKILLFICSLLYGESNIRLFVFLWFVCMSCPYAVTAYFMHSIGVDLKERCYKFIHYIEFFYFLVVLYVIFVLAQVLFSTGFQMLLFIYLSVYVVSIITWLIRSAMGEYFL